MSALIFLFHDQVLVEPSTLTRLFLRIEVGFSFANKTLQPENRPLLLGMQCTETSMRCSAYARVNSDQGCSTSGRQFLSVSAHLRSKRMQRVCSAATVAERDWRKAKPIKGKGIALIQLLHCHRPQAHV